MTYIEELKQQHPEAQYDTPGFGSLWDENDEVIANGINSLIAEYYDGRDIVVSHPSGNPELEEIKLATGAQYIATMFEGDYSKAWEAI